MNGRHLAAALILTLLLGAFFPRAEAQTQLSALNGATFVKITTTDSGLQSVSAASVAALLGQPVATVTNAIAAGQFQLTTSGLPVTWLASPDASTLFFYAEAFKNYSTNNIYWLTSGSNGTVGVENGGAPTPTAAATWYPAAQFCEIYANYESSLPMGPDEDPWMTCSLVSGTINASYNYLAGVNNLTQGGDRAGQLAVQLWGGDPTTHTVQVTINNNAAQVLSPLMTWTGLTATNFTLSIPSTWLVSGLNYVTFLAVTNNGSAKRSGSYVNSFTLSYPSTYTAVNGLIDCTANSNLVISITGFTSPNITLLDVTNPKQPSLVTNVTVDQAYRLNFVPAGPAAHYVAWQTGAPAPVYNLALGQVAGFASGTNGADYVIVSPPSLLPAATNLANYRQQTGLKTLIAPLNEVYNEFGYGFPTPHAIQSLMTTAWANWAIRPHYLVLLGRGTYDFLNIEQDYDNLTPPLMVSTQFGVFATDSLMGVVTTNGLPSVAVGRLSGLTTNDINGLINKIISYESNAPPVSPQGLLIADVADSAGNFDDDILQANAVLTNVFNDTLLVSQNANSASPLYSEILTNWNNGVDFVNYAGHGAINQFGFAGYLTVADVTNYLLNCPRLPVVTAMTCVSGEYAVPGVNCLGEYLLKPPGGGAIAFFSATGLSLSGEASELNVRLTTLLQANSRYALGDMIVQAVAAHITQDLPTVPVWIYNLLGDPALHYNITRTLAPMQISISSNSMSWSGGLPPYQLQISTNLANPNAWQPLGAPLMGYNVRLTNNIPSGYIRLEAAQ